jgi:hypothetical protein
MFQGGRVVADRIPSTKASRPERFQPFDLLKLPENGKGIKDGKRVRFGKRDYK